MLYPSWKLLMARYGTQYLTKQKEATLASYIQWESTSYCLVTEEYRMKERLLRLAFSDLLDTPMLDAPALKRSALGADEDEINADDGDGDDESSAASGAASQAHTPSLSSASGAASHASRTS